MGSFISSVWLFSVICFTLGVVSSMSFRDGLGLILRCWWGLVLHMFQRRARYVSFLLSSEAFGGSESSLLSVGPCA